MNTDKMVVPVRVAIYCNQAGEGYKVYGEGIEGFEHVRGEGFLAEYFPEGGGAAIYAGKDITEEGRSAQRNVCVIWERYLPAAFLPSLKARMDRMGLADLNRKTLTLYRSELPDPSAELLAGILEALQEGIPCAIDQNGVSEEEVLAALSRVCVSEDGFSLALPLPSGAEHRDVNYYPLDGRYRTRPVDQLIHLSASWWDAEPSEEIQKKAKSLSEAGQWLAEMAGSCRSERIYTLYDALVRGTPYDRQSSDDRLLRSLLEHMDEKEKNRILLRMMTSAGSDARAASEGKRRKEQSREASYSENRNRSRILWVVLLLVCMAASAVLLFLGASVTPETVILFQDGSELAVLGVGLLWGLFVGLALRR